MILRKFFFVVFAVLINACSDKCEDVVVDEIDKLAFGKIERKTCSLPIWVVKSSNNSGVRGGAGHKGAVGKVYNINVFVPYFYAENIKTEWRGYLPVQKIEQPRKAVATKLRDLIPAIHYHDAHGKGFYFDQDGDFIGTALYFEASDWVNIGNILDIDVIIEDDVLVVSAKEIESRKAMLSGD